MFKNKILAAELGGLSTSQFGVFPFELLDQNLAGISKTS
jgi:hypothetical protein